MRSHRHTCCSRSDVYAVDAGADSGAYDELADRIVFSSSLEHSALEILSGRD
jgi:hypothetical protein